MLSGILAQSYEEHGDVGHVVAPLAPMPIPANRREPNGIRLMLPPIAAVVGLFGGKKGDRYTVNLVFSGPDNQPLPFPIQNKTWPGKPGHRIILQTEGVPVMFRNSGIWRIAVLINGKPAGEMFLPIYWDDESPPPLPEFEPRR